MRLLVPILLLALSLPVRAGHWAFVAPRDPVVPGPAANPIDAFVERALKRSGLRPAPEADRRTLIRRLSYTLTGLPPRPGQVRDFLRDRDPAAYERLVERLLNSPHYGEHWGRHWLDVARYSDSKGYVYGREERFWTHAWAYRDWVVKALNADLPYDRFLLLQIAADQVADRAPGDEAAMGFLTLGRRFLGVKRDIIDDRIDVVTRGTMALTVSCARCHDHKYDPIPTADYYSLFGVFDSSVERAVALGDPATGGEAFQKRLRELQAKYDQTFAKHRKAASDRARARVADYLCAQAELEKYPAEGFDQILEAGDLMPAFVHRWRDFLRRAKEQGDRLFVPWFAYFGKPVKDFPEITRRLAGRDDLPPPLARAFEAPPRDLREVAERYAAVLKEDAFRQVLHGADSPCEVPDLPIVHTENFFSSGEVNQLYKQQGDIDRWIIRSRVEAPRALMLVDGARPVNARVYLRGNPLTPGPEVPRQFLQLLAGEERRPFARGSGRLELARAIVDPANPLTARVIVNRVWMHHFGQGLVKTPSDFGLRAPPPSHPELLDWLTCRFIEDGWSLKRLHRRILTSAAFRRASGGPAVMRHPGLRRDPENRLLWRMNPRRLSFEELRDAMLAASGDLDHRIGGKPVDLFKTPYPRRRSLYGLIDRQFFPSTLRVFDVATPDLHVPRRPETTVPQQALFFLNDPLVLDRAWALAALTSGSATPADRVRGLFEQALQRGPTAAEMAESLALVSAVKTAPPPKRPTVDDWSYGHGELDESSGRVKGFAPLPHFTGKAWQGGARWPDARLGWVQLHATGGHPGNTRKVAAVRRWTAPRDLNLRIESRLAHEAAPGDGIRAFIVSSRAGVLQSTNIHRQTVELDLPRVRVARGDTIDFVVDINRVLNNDQYLWRATLRDADLGMAWDSELDFPGDRTRHLSGWEQLAQALLCSNEFLFVD